MDTNGARLAAVVRRAEACVAATFKAHRSNIGNFNMRQLENWCVLLETLNLSVQLSKLPEALAGCQKAVCRLGE